MLLPTASLLVLFTVHAKSAPKGEDPSGTTVEMEFEPLGLRGPNSQELLSMLSGSAAPRGMAFAASGPDLGALFNNVLSAGQLPRRNTRGRGHLGSGDIFGDEFYGTGGQFGAIPFGGSSNLPVTVFHDLFPGSVTSDGPDEVEVMNSVDGPDFMMDNMLQHINRMFKDEMLPVLHRMSSRKPNAACQDDARRLCNGTKSQLHCLGQHADKISERCRKSVGKSVPFLCHKAISQSCDLLDRGLLPCLADRLSELDGPCRDAVVTTHKVIAKVNTQKATLTDPVTGEKVEHLPTVAVKANKEKHVQTPSPVPAAQKEVQLDKIIATPTANPTAAEEHSSTSSTRQSSGPVNAEPHRAAMVQHSGAPSVPPSSLPTAAAAAAAVAQTRVPLQSQGESGHSVSGLLQAVVLLGLIGACIYLLKPQLSLDSLVSGKTRCVAKSGALLELNTNAGEHML